MRPDWKVSVSIGNVGPYVIVLCYSILNEMVQKINKSKIMQLLVLMLLNRDHDVLRTSYSSVIMTLALQQFIF